MTRQLANHAGGAANDHTHAIALIDQHRMPLRLHGRHVPPRGSGQKRMGCHSRDLTPLVRFVDACATQRGGPGLIAQPDLQRWAERGPTAPRPALTVQGPTGGWPAPLRAYPSTGKATPFVGPSPARQMLSSGPAAVPARQGESHPRHGRQPGVDGAAAGVGRILMAPTAADSFAGPTPPSTTRAAEGEWSAQGGLSGGAGGSDAQPAWWAPPSRQPYPQKLCITCNP